MRHCRSKVKVACSLLMLEDSSVMVMSASEGNLWRHINIQWTFQLSKVSPPKYTHYPPNSCSTLLLGNKIPSWLICFGWVAQPPAPSPPQKQGNKVSDGCPPHPLKKKHGFCSRSFHIEPYGNRSSKTCAVQAFSSWDSRFVVKGDQLIYNTHIYIYL